MSNKLEGFVKENKKAFEEQGPSDKLWQRISLVLDKTEAQRRKKINVYQWMGVAAVLVISLSVYFTLHNQALNTIDVADINPVFGKKELQFANLIEEKKDSLQIYSEENPELYKRFISDISQLDEDYEALKKQLQTSPDRDAVVRAMMKNLEVRANILSQQLNIINQVNQYKKENTI